MVKPEPTDKLKSWQVALFTQFGDVHNFEKIHKHVVFYKICVVSMSNLLQNRFLAKQKNSDLIRVQNVLYDSSWLERISVLISTSYL